MKHRNIFILVTAVVLAFCMTLSFVGCGSTGDETETEETEATEETTEAVDPASEYDIAAGLVLNDDGEDAILVGNGFELTMPNTGTWSYNVTGLDSMELYYLTAAEADFGGIFLTIVAMDIDDNTYEEWPSYAVAGVNEDLGKRFIAMYPTDVQYNPEDPYQEEEYMTLLDHVRTINETSAGSPFVIK
ncbi:MAG: hypothetical protein IJI74_06285 [Firmicutes bacterium]|nr:hypothetical protein [Bacillota bacterium]